MPINSSRTVVICLFLSLLATANLLAQKQVGAVWDTPSDNQSAFNELNKFADLGISLLIIDTQLKEETWRKIDSLGFSVYGDLSIEYPTVSTFASPDSALLDQISTGVNHFIAQPSVASIGLFRLGQSRSDRFREALQPIIQQIDTTASAELYYTSLFSEPVPTDALIDFKLLQVKKPERLAKSAGSSKVRGYIDMGETTLLTPVKKLLEHAEKDSIPVFFYSSWLNNMTNDHPEFAEALQHYAATGEVVFPLPKEPRPAQPSHNLIVALMLFILCTFVLNYQYSPIYKKTISRYFLAHKFLVDDIMDRHVRTISPALVILFQHIIAMGIMMYCLGNVLIADAGWGALKHHYPDFFISQNPLMNLFLWGCLLSLVTHLISILWIRLTNKEVTHFSQVTLLYSWPLQLNFVISLLIVTLMISGSFYGLIYILCTLFMLIFLGAFIITAFDTSDYLTKRRMGFLLGSAGIYSLLWIGLCIWVFSSSYLLDVLSLAVSLP